MVGFVVIAEPMVGTYDIDVIRGERVKLVLQSNELVGPDIPYGNLAGDKHRLGACELLDVAVEEVGDDIHTIGITGVQGYDGQPAGLYLGGQTAALPLPIVDGEPVEVGAVVGIDLALDGAHVVPYGDDAQSGLLEIALGELAIRLQQVGLGWLGVVAGVVGIIGHSVSQSRGATHEAVLGCGLAVIVVEHHGGEVGQGRTDGPVHGHLSPSSLLKDFGHSVLAVLYVVAVADVDGGIHLVLQLRALGHGRDAYGLVDGRIYRGVLEEVGGYGGETVFGGFAHSRTFFGIPSQHDIASGFHVAEHLVEQQTLFACARVEPHTCRAACRSYVVHIGYGGADADEQAVVATAPVVVIKIGVDVEGRGQLELGKVFHHWKVHAVGYELRPDFGCHREQSLQSGYGDGQVGIVFAQLVAVEHQPLDFVLVQLSQRVRFGNGYDGSPKSVCRWPGVLRLLVVVIEDDARAGAVDESLQGAEHHALFILEGSRFHVE